ncbi:MAG: hypothetical protein JNG84_06400 [Archangium sp.]|nr:hypothetical protein [Archangium sp.]
MKGVLLGPQRLSPTLLDVVKAMGIEGRIVTITAGWQEREDQVLELHASLGAKRCANLELYHRGEKVFAKDKELAALHRVRQDTLRERQDYYRMRLERIVDAALDIGRRAAGSRVEAEEESLSMELIRKLDLDHLAHCRASREAYEREATPWERPLVKKHRAEIAELLEGASAIAIAGGHVAVLLNRLRLFGVAELLTKKQLLLAWSGGAMVTSERVVLFHESPPQGVGISEVMDEGLGLHRGVLPLPNPKLRLKLDDTFRVGWMARRNLPAKCVAFDSGEYVHFTENTWHGASGTHLLNPDGTCSEGWAS